MSMVGATDILVQDEPDRNRLRIAVSRAFGIDPGLVTVDDADGRMPIPADAKVVLLRQPGEMPGDFPAWFSQAVDTDLEDRVDAAWDAVARTLSLTILTEAPDDESTAHLPDGTRRVLFVPEEDEGGYRMTPELLHLIELATQNPMRLAS
ncbi:MAG: hypothetical protein QM753_10585 [Thermomicrobiales bacterium]